MPAGCSRGSAGSLRAVMVGGLLALVAAVAVALVFALGDSPGRHRDPGAARP
ncbi:MAG TPA: hypothetical protein VG474_17420 [Solirubrobacteraceae bacterium]|nr:hypothetical protein [Solirubrobacteraceae bacterium]